MASPNRSALRKITQHLFAGSIPAIDRARVGALVVNQEFQELQQSIASAVSGSMFLGSTYPQ